MYLPLCNVAFLTGEDLAEAAARIGVSVPVIRAVASVAAHRSGFIAGTTLPQIRLEGHQFHRLTRGAHSREHPSISHECAGQINRYAGGRDEYRRLRMAIRVHGAPEPALLATAWGKFQLLGVNHVVCGHADVRDFVNDMASGEPAQLRAFVAFLEAGPLAGMLRDGAWEAFAHARETPGYVPRTRHVRLAATFARALAAAQDHRAPGAFDQRRGDGIAIQAALNVMLGDALSEQLVPDGWLGAKTRAAICQFQRLSGLPETGRAYDPRLREKLGLLERKPGEPPELRERVVA